MLLEDIQSTNLSGGDVSSAIWVQLGSKAERVVTNMDSFLLFAHPERGDAAQWHMLRDKSMNNDTLLALLMALYDHAAKEKLVPAERAWGERKIAPAVKGAKTVKFSAKPAPPAAPAAPTPAAPQTDPEDPPK